MDKYRYLGIILNEHLDFNINATGLATSAIRVHGFSAFTILYHSGVVPILDYCPGIRIYQNIGQIDTIQNQAIHFYIGVHKFGPNLAKNDDILWISSSSMRRKSEMLHYWNRLIHVDSERLTKTFFIGILIENHLEIGIVMFTK